MHIQTATHRWWISDDAKAVGNSSTCKEYNRTNHNLLLSQLLAVPTEVTLFSDHGENCLADEFMLPDAAILGSRAERYHRD